LIASLIHTVRKVVRNATLGASVLKSIGTAKVLLALSLFNYFVFFTVES
jgi:hypothetical protein